MKIIKKLNKLEWTLIIGISLLNILSFILTKDINIIGIISSITGVICVVLTAKGHISCYYWGLVNLATYILIAWQAHFYGEVMLNALYYLPMQFVGIYLWKRNSNKETELVKAKKMNIKQIIITISVAVIGTIGYSFILKLLGGNQPLIDSTTNILSILAMFLSVKRFKEQWLIWILVDIVTIYLWITALIQNEQNSLVMVLMWSFYLINAVNGYINWSKIERK